MKKDFNYPLVLFSQLKKGNEKAYVFLVDTYHQKLNAYALSLTNDSHSAQDIVQNVFIKTWEYRKKLDEKHSIQSFLYKSVYNEFINQYWKGQSKRSLEGQYIKTLNQIVEEFDADDLKKLKVLVFNEIETLPKKCKTVFLLSKQEGLTNIEISEYLNISIKSVEGHITKAYSIIRNKIDVNPKLLLFVLFGLNHLNYN